jgi:hypothetical protein
MESVDSAALPCADKLVFDTKQQADVAANVAQYQRGLSLKAYKCRYCGLWHLSSQPND